MENRTAREAALALVRILKPVKTHTLRQAALFSAELAGVGLELGEAVAQPSPAASGGGVSPPGAKAGAPPSVQPEGLKCE
jgi:hypothetical protein